MKKGSMNRIVALVLAFLVVCSSVLAVPATELKAAPKATKITLAKRQTIYLGGKGVTLKIKSVKPAGASKKVTWTSDNTAVATVSKKGKVTPVGIGTANITAQAKGSKAKAKCKITVKQGVTEIQTAKTITMQKGKKVSLKVGVSPANAANKKLKYSVKGKAVKVDKKGKITAKKTGKATVTVASADGCKKVSVKVNVKKKFKAATSVTLNNTSLAMNKGTTATLTAACTSPVYWISSNTSVATVANGVVTAVGDGAATITAVAADYSGKSATCAVTVTTPAPVVPTPPVVEPDVPVKPAEVKVTAVTLDREADELKVGDTVQLNATVAPADATNKAVTWSTSDAAVATVENGLVTAVAAGTATITVASVENPAITDTYAVTVKAEEEPPVEEIEVESVTVDPTEVTLKVNETAEVNATVAPANATHKKITWSTSDAAIATVDETGLITAVAAGNATVTATSVNGKKATVAVTVTEEVVVEDEIIHRADGVTTITLKDDTDYTVAYTNGDKTVERTVKAEDAQKAYDKYLEGLTKVTTVEQLWNKVTTDTYNAIVDRVGKDYGVTVEVSDKLGENTKVITVTRKELTEEVTVMLNGDKITIMGTNSKLTGGAAIVYIDDIDIANKTAAVEYDGYRVNVSWSETSAEITRNNSKITATYADGKYVLVINDFFASEMYDKVLSGTTVEDERIPADYEAALAGLTIVEAE